MKEYLSLSIARLPVAAYVYSTSAGPRRVEREKGEPGMPDTPPTPSRRNSSLQAAEGGSESKSGGTGLSSRKKVGTEWECVDLLRGGPNPRWRCKSCLTEYTGAPRRIAQHILGAGGVGQIKPCPRPLQEYVTLMTDLMALDAESGRLVKKSKGEEGGAVAGAGAVGGGGGGASTPPVKSRRKPRPSTQSGSSSQSNSQEMFDVFLAKEDFKFSSSHFVAYDGFRERLHGHNYSCSIRLKGEVCEDGYVVDFGIIKKAMRKLCKELNERFLCPMKSDALNITLTGAQVVMVCQDGATFVLPRDDCALLPLVHSTAEELAHHLFVRLLRDFTLPYLHARGVTDMEVSVAELPRQEATYRGKIPLTEDMIRDPPFRGARRVEGCFRDDDDFSGSNVHYPGSAGASGSMGVLGNGMGGNSGSSLGISNTNQLHQQQPGAYPYGTLLGDSGWGGPSSGVSGSTVPGGRMRLGGAGGAAAAALAAAGASDIVLPGLRPGSGGVSASQGFSTGQGTGGGAGLGLGQESPLGGGSRSM